tara:strand:- start:35 stop:409 length:375 start_codon:yes stop_codon:yes gene_type:complete
LYFYLLDLLDVFDVLLLDFLTHLLFPDLRDLLYAQRLELLHERFFLPEQCAGFLLDFLPLDFLPLDFLPLDFLTHLGTTPFFVCCFLNEHLAALQFSFDGEATFKHLDLDLFNNFDAFLLNDLA